MSEIVYTSEYGTKYTKKDIKDLIKEYVTSSSRFVLFKNFDYIKVEKVLYDYIMNVITWEHPWTILDQIDGTEEEDIILDRIKAA